MKKFFEEFKKFITRGNVVDMAVGVIVGGAFTAIVNGLGNNILKPIVNWLLALILGANTLSELYTPLKPVYKDILDEAGAIIGQELDLAQSIYIDWGAFINAIINFFIIAFVLFIIVKIINKIRESSDNLMNKISSKKLTKEQRAEIKAAGIKRTDRKAIDAYLPERNKKILTDNRALFGSRNSNRISTDAVHRLVKKAFLQAGLDATQFSAHKLRHTAATMMLSGGVDVKTVQEVLGHENLNTTQIYTHIESSELKMASLANPLSKLDFSDDDT